jgi:cyclase
LEKHIKNLGEVNPGEIILTSIDHDGMMNGYDIEKIKKISNSSSIPIIASGGAGCANDFYQLIKGTNIKALSAASIFHFTEITPLDVKKFLKTKNINVRL